MSYFVISFENPQAAGRFCDYLATMPQGEGVVIKAYDGEPDRDEMIAALRLVHDHMVMCKHSGAQMQTRSGKAVMTILDRVEKA
jgi:hypothetical protein